MNKMSWFVLGVIFASVLVLLAVPVWLVTGVAAVAQLINAAPWRGPSTCDGDVVEMYVDIVYADPDAGR